MAQDAKEEETKARKRMAVILQVESGMMSVTDGAEALGVSRTTYYEWADRALSSMSQALEDKPSGRPALPVDAEKVRMEKELAETKADLERAMLALDIKNTLEMLRREEAQNLTSGLGVKKNTRSVRRARKR